MVDASRLEANRRISVRVRYVFAIVAMRIVWLLFAIVVAIGGWEFVPLVGWIAVFAAFTFVFFALPFLGFTSATWQLRRWYVLLALSIAWSLALGSFFSHESPVRMFTDGYPGNLLGFALVIYAGLAVAIYLLLLSQRLRSPARVHKPERANVQAHL